MNSQQFEIILDSVRDTKKITLDITHISSNERTLLHGYTCNKYTHHVYLKNKLIHVYVHSGPDLVEYIYGQNLSVSVLIPDKRLYPQYCDYETCHYLISEGVYLPFTRYNEPQPTRASASFFGNIYTKESNHA